MTYTPFNDDDTCRREQPDLWERTPSYPTTPGYFDREWTPSVICPSPDAEDIVGECSPSLYQHPSDQLSFNPAVEREESIILPVSISKAATASLGGFFFKPSVGSSGWRREYAARSA